MQRPVTLPGYTRLDGVVPILYKRGAEEHAAEVLRLVKTGTETLSALFDVEPPELTAMLVAAEDWDAAPREGEWAYPPGLPYFTRSVRPPALVLPTTLSHVFRPHTQATYPLTVWHELAHAFLLRKEVVRTPAWLQEFIPQVASVAVARRANWPLDGHLSRIDHEPGFTIRGLKGHVGADGQMAFQNLLLVLGAATVEELGDAFLYPLVRALWRETEVVDEERAEGLLAKALGPGGREWLESRLEF